MIIGFSGKKGTGKTTASNYVSRLYGFKTRSFASPLRDIAKSLFGFKDTDFHLNNKEKPFLDYDWCPREFMVNLGQFLRYHDTDYWVKRIGLDKVYDYSIDDVRFKNEAEHIKKMGGIIIRIERYTKQNPYYNSAMANDISETDLDDYEFDYRITEPQNVELEDLQAACSNIMKTLNRKRL